MISSRAGESGNIMFLILIAVVLFAALSFAVTMSNRGGGSDMNAENMRILASRITQHAMSYENAVVRLRISKGIAENAIDFDTPRAPGYDNPGCAGDICHVFNAEGGQAVYIDVDRKWLDGSQAGGAHYGYWLFTGGICVPGIGLGDDASCNADPANNELIALVPWVLKDICIQINRKLGIPLDNGNPPRLTGNAWPAANEQFIGSFAAGETIIDTNNVLYGHPEACFEGGGTPPNGSYHYYRVIFPR